MTIVVLASDAPELCGVEAFARNLAGALAREGTRTRVESLPAGRAGWVDFARRLRPADAVLVNLPVVAWKRRLLGPLAALACARLRGARAVLALHEWGDLDWKRRALCRAYLLAADTVLVSSPHVEAQIRADRWMAPLSRLWRGRLAGALPVPPNVRPPAATVPSVLAARLKAWRAEGRFVLAAFGSIYPRKQTPRLLDIVEALKRRGERPVLALIGSFIETPGNTEAGFRTRIAERGLADDVVLSGYVPDEAHLFGLLGAVDAFAYVFVEGLTSRRGSVLACLQAGRPVVVNAPLSADEFAHHRAYRAQIESGRLTLVAPDADPDAYAETLLATRGRALPGTPPEFDACWADAACALLEALRPCVAAAPVQERARPVA